MKSRFFLIYLFSVLLLFALNLQGDNDYTSHPSVGVDHSSFTKYVNTQTGESTWYRDWIGGVVTVYVSASMDGIGEGQGTLTNISIFANSIPAWQNPESNAGTTNPNGSWSSGTGTAQALYPASIPPDGEDGDTWEWSSGGYTEVWPLEWHESTSWGVNISVPTGISGRYTTTGSWENGTKVMRYANSASGPITLNIVYTGEDEDPPDDGSGSDPGGGSSDPPDDGSSSSSGCTTSAYGNFCDDQGSCSTGSGSGVPGPECGENWCCCASYDDSGSDPGSESDGPGDDSDSDGSSPGCSNNPDYNWCTDNGSCSTGSNDGVPGPECGQNYCCCHYNNGSSITPE